MTEEEIKKIVAATVSETLLKMGVSTDDPIEAQKDFMHLRSWRQSTEAVKRQSIIAAIGIATAGTLALIWQTIKN